MSKEKKERVTRKNERQKFNIERGKKKFKGNEKFTVQSLADNLVRKDFRREYLVQEN
jgi:hypothetical protein